MAVKLSGEKPIKQLKYSMRNYKIMVHSHSEITVKKIEVDLKILKKRVP